MTFHQWYNDWKTNRPNERLGQAFVSDFIKGNWPELFYNRNDSASKEIIEIWLTDIQMWPNLPEKADQGYQSNRLPFIYGN